MYKSRKSIMWIRNRTNPHNWKPSEIKIICFLQIFSLKTITLKVIKTKTYKLCMFFYIFILTYFLLPGYQLRIRIRIRMEADPGSESALHHTRTHNPRQKKCSQGTKEIRWSG